MSTTAAYPTEGGHPVIDCRPLFLRSQDANAARRRAETVEQLKAALSADGYFYAKMGELLPLDLVERVYSAAAAAHALPREEVLQKKYVGKEAPYRGWSDQEPSYDGVTASTVHSWDFGRDVPPLPPADPDYEYCGPNIYPSVGNGRNSPPRLR